MKYSLILVPLAGIITLATAQYGPAPPRINIPGAIALPPIREERLLPQQPPQDNRQVPIARAQIPERFFATDKEPVGPSGGAQRFAIERPQPQQPAPKQYRPAPQPQQIARPVAAPPARQHYQDQDQERRPVAQHQPGRSHSQQEEDRKRKPVAQILRKWREEHEDGSITWGFENDDGSFKEETIGIDCVTRGRYGYVDPDGEKREYNYETGILCDPNRRDEDDDEDNLEVDYQENKAVLPNGVRLNLNNMGKKQSKRPGGEQQQQQQYYRN